MSVIEIVLIIIGAGVFLLGYFLPAGKKDADEEVQLISEAEIRKLVEGETETVREKVSDIVEETIGYSIEKTERAMERVANEKIMAVNEYSDTVLEEINKNHKEVTFLYDMLNDKHDTLMADIGQANQVVEEIRQTVRDAEITAEETAKKAQEAAEAAEGALMRIHKAESSAREAQDAVQEAVQSVMGAVEDTRTDLWSIHSAGTYSPEVVEEVQASRVFPTMQEEELPYDLEPEYLTHEPVSEAVEEVDFQPIKPRRVEIIHEPEADYVAEEQELSTSAAFAEMGIFGNREPEVGREPAGREFGSGRESVGREFGSGREPAGRRGAAPVHEEPRGVDIRFAQGKDNGRNSNERILELHKAGKSNMAIAKELGLGLGEVKLVIDLFEGM
ncbi:MAG: DUF6115 domain-containing protein [Lachnospiraceae bacterium]|nr:DUF6115 domain-containing protein [Lachnospiraceae bacterium]